MYKLAQAIFLLATVCFATPITGEVGTLEERTTPSNPLCPSSGRSSSPVKTGCLYPVPYVGNFTNAAIWDFTKLTDLPDDLVVDELYVPKGNVRGAAFDQTYTASNVFVSNGSLQIKVPGGQKKEPLLGGQVETGVQDIIYASVRTIAQVSSISGTCHGLLLSW